MFTFGNKVKHFILLGKTKHAFSFAWENKSDIFLIGKSNQRINFYLGKYKTAQNFLLLGKTNTDIFLFAKQSVRFYCLGKQKQIYFQLQKQKL